MGEVATRTIAEDLHFPECLRWYEGRLYFSDMYGDAVYRLDPGDGSRETVAEVFHPGGIGWLPDGRMLVVASEDRQVLEVGGTGGPRVYADLSQLAPGWVNDLLVDERGDVYAGNFGYDLFAEEPRATRLIVIAADGSVTVGEDEVVFPNGMVLRSDGALVVAETFGGCLSVFDREPAGAGLRRRSQIALGEAHPDGICIDAEDHVWIASVMDGAVVRVGPDGPGQREPVSQLPFACVLGGEDRRTLFVATAPDFEPAARRAATEGRIEALEVAVPGVGRQGLGRGA